MPNSYQYEAAVVWTEGRAGQATSEGLPTLHVSAPPEFDGAPGMWTPEHLLAAATASCLMTTFLSIAERFKLPIAEYRSKVVARLEKIAGEGYRFTEITVVPEIEIAAEDVDKAREVLAKAEKYCFISNSLRATVQVEPRFLVVAALGT